VAVVEVYIGAADFGEDGFEQEAARFNNGVGQGLHFDGAVGGSHYGGASHKQ
jgi:hypothetical protein